LIPSTLKKTCFMVSGITQFVEVCKCYFWAIPNSIVNTNVAGTASSVASGWMSSPRAGQQVSRFSQGGNSPIISTGRIESLHYIGFIPGLPPGMFMSAHYGAANGDSGGIVLCTDSRVPAGIHVGISSSTHVAVFSHVLDIMAALRVTPI